MRFFLNSLLALAVLAVGVLPLLLFGSTPQQGNSHLATVLYINFIGWLVVFAFIVWNAVFHYKINRIAANLGVDTRFKTFEKLLGNLLSEVSRKNDAFAINLIEKRITSKRELSRALEQIVNMAFKSLSAESAELALFDRDSGMYHSSFVLGKPFRSSAQAMLSKAVEEGIEEISPDVLVAPITFAGSILGTLRVALKRGTLPSGSDRDLIRLLAQQGSVAIINAQYTEQLIQMKRASEESVKAKTGFLANLSHEIRGPLGIMLNAVELVLDGLCGNVTQDQSETLSMVRTNGEHLLELINDVLDYAKVESGRVTPQPVEILVDDLLKDIINVVRTQAEAKQHKLNLKSSDEALAIKCDRRHMRQMLINLLTNAIKYTPDGGTIHVWAERVPVNKIRINVKDSGIGIEESNRYKVFAAFERIENAYSITQTGAGLGMPLTKRLAEVNGALIDFRSSPNKGSHFWLVFPAIQYNPTVMLQPKEKEQPVKGKGELILLVEKDEGERNMLRRYLENLGFKVQAVSSRLQAIDSVRTSKVELIVIDNNALDNPKEDLLAGIRDNAHNTRPTPIMLITSRAFNFDTEKYLKSGVDRCLVKPVDLKDFGKICRSLIDGTYSGAVHDGTESHSGKKPSEEGSKENSKTRLVELDDMLH